MASDKTPFEATAMSEAHISAQRPMSLLDRLWAWRDRRFADPAFQRRLATFPLTRHKARREAQAAFDTCTGFVHTQIVTACLELGVFRSLSAAPCTPAELAARVSVPEQSMEMLLMGAAALRLVVRRGGGRWGLSAKGAAIAGSPALQDIIRHNQIFYGDLRDPVALLRGGTRKTELSQYWPYAESSSPERLSSQEVEKYCAFMSSSQHLVGEDVVRAYPFARHRRVLDVGGGEGVFLSILAGQHSGLELRLFDLPAVAERARVFLAGRGLADRVAVAGGSFRTDVLPSGADLISLVRIVHDHDDDVVLTLLKAVRTALAPGGSVLIAEPMSGGAGGGTMSDAYFGFYLLAMGSGKPRTASALGGLLAEAGFAAPKIWPTARPMMVQVLSAQAC